MEFFKRKKLNIFTLLFLGIVFIFGVIQSFKPNTTSPEIKPPSSNQLFKVVRVLDGDTIEIEGGQKVRYIGIDTAEMDDKDSIKRCFAKKAFEKNKELIEGKEVRLEKDISETDKYGRLLRYVYVGDIFVNDYLVRNGFANAVTYPPDIRFKEQFLEAEKEAKENNRGLWDSSACLE